MIPTPRGVLTLVLSGATLLGMFVRPKSINVAWVTATGGLLLVALGLVPIDEAVAVVAKGKEALLFLVALLLLAALVDQSGFFGWAAMHAARRAHGSARALHRNVFVLGSLVTIALSLDTTAVLLTPIVLACAARLRLSPTPYVVTCAFVANGASLLLPVSNLTNLLLVRSLGGTYTAYALRMLLPQLVALVLMYVLLRRRFRAELEQSFDVDALAPPSSMVESPAFFRVALAVLALALVGFFVAPLLGAPPYVVAFAAVVVLAGYAVATGRGLGALARHFPWGVFPFVAGLFVVVQAIARLGIDAAASAWFAETATSPTARVTLAAVLGVIGSNLSNNLPAVMLAQSILEQRAADAPAIYGTLLGVNLGPNLMPFASLATMLVLASAEARGCAVRRREIIRAGLWCTPVVVLGATLTLAATFVVRP